MRKEFIKSKDLIAGLIFTFFGIAAIWLARGYPMGSARRMGPAYFPTIVGGALAVFGFILSVRSVWSPSEPVHLPTPRPVIMITIGVVSFALLLEPLGLVLALLALILISCLGGSNFRVHEVAILYFILAFIAIIFFVYGLALQFPLWPTLMNSVIR